MNATTNRAFRATIEANERDLSEVLRLQVSMMNEARSNWGAKPERVRLLNKRIEATRARRAQLMNN